MKKMPKKQKKTNKIIKQKQTNKQTKKHANQQKKMPFISFWICKNYLWLN